MTDLRLLAGRDVELVGRRADHWQLAAVATLAYDDPTDWVAALVDATTGPVLIADIIDSDTALLLADSPRGNQWSTVLTTVVDSGPRAMATANTETMAAATNVALAWAHEAGQAVTAEAVTEALCAADRNNRATDQALLDAGDDLAAMAEIVRNQTSFIEVYVLRLLAALGLAVPVIDDGSFWIHLANQARTLSS